MKKQLFDRFSNKNNIYDNNNMRILKVQNSLVQQKNQFVEHELQKKHLVVKKLSDINTSRPNPGRRGKKGLHKTF